MSVLLLIEGGVPGRGLIPAALLILGLGCLGGGSSSSSGTFVPPQISPANPTVFVDQSLQLQVNSPWTTGIVWSVRPAGAGTITSGGLFTAGPTPGICTVEAVRSGTGRFDVTAQLGIYPAPPPAVSTPNLAQAAGSRQTSAGGGIVNGPVVGELLPASTATSPTQSIQVRDGFTPP
jgi:hypothetical protein